MRSPCKIVVGGMYADNAADFFAGKSHLPEKKSLPCGFCAEVILPNFQFVKISRCATCKPLGLQPLDFAEILAESGGRFDSLKGIKVGCADCDSSNP